MVSGLPEKQQRVSRENQVRHGSNTAVMVKKEPLPYGLPATMGGRPSSYPYLKHTFLSAGSLSDFQLQHKGLHQGRGKGLSRKNLSRSSCVYSSALRRWQGQEALPGQFLRGRDGADQDSAPLSGHCVAPWSPQAEECG